MNRPPSVGKTELAKRLSKAQADSLPAALQGRYAFTRRLPGGVHGPSWVLQDLRSEANAVLRYLSVPEPAIASFIDVLRGLSAATKGSADVVHVHKVFEEDTTVWLLRDWVPGENFGEVMAMLRRLTVAQTCAIVTEICKGLLVGDQEHLIHGHLCPENVLIHSNGSVYISDHGLCPAGARTIGPRSHSYLAPEVVATGEPTACSDVYALGALLYVGICGRYPLPLTGRVEVDHTILREHKLLPPPSGVKLHGRIGQVIWRALQPCPEDRFASAREVLIALEELSTLASKGALLSRLLRR